MNEQEEKVKDFLITRQQAYKQVFNPESETVKLVMADIERFCRAKETTFHTDARVHAVLEGRREVYLRIREQLDLTPDELWKKKGKDSE